MTDDTDRIHVGEGAESGEPVSLPVIDVLAGRGFITGKSGSGKSNTASVVAEQLLEAGYGLLIVDVDGEYYGLKEEYELLHAGADEECDIRVSPEHAEKLATLALEENVPIILDVSSYLDPDDADEMLLAVARQLFAKAKKQKKPFLVLVEECHEYIPEGGGMSETGKMLIKIGKRGRKHGLGIVGMSQRPADVKKDFITQCDWLVWHRLTWDNDTRVVGRILGSEYADLVEDLGDGEAFLDADWNDDIRRVQFDRKRTFDAGATPGLGDFERPELQSVSEDLVADLQQVSEERERHESEVAALESELEEKTQRIEELEAELAEARDMSEMADKFAQALVENAESSPPESAPADPEVAEAEEFVADAARGGYPGDEAVPGKTQPGTTPAETATAQESSNDLGEDAEFGDEEPEELLTEDQRDLYEYEADAEPGGSGSKADASTAMNTDGGEPNTAEEAEIAEGADSGDDKEPDPSEPADTDEDSAALEDDEDEEESESAEDEPGDEPDEESEAVGADGDEASTQQTGGGSLDESEATEDSDPSGLKPVRTISSAERGPEFSDDGSTEADDPEDAVEDAEGQEEDAPEVSEPSVEADKDEDDDEGTETGSVHEASTEESLDSEPDSTEESPEADELELAEEPESEADTATESERKTLEATGDWPNADDGAEPIDRDEPLTAGEVSPADEVDSPEELQDRLAEEFGITMETDSDLTGGSLGSSAGAAEDTKEHDSAERQFPGEDSGPEPVADEASEVPTDAENEPEANAEPSDGSSDPMADRTEQLTELVEAAEMRDETDVVRTFVHRVRGLDDVTLGMLAHYREAEDSPVEAHLAAGGSGERQYAYARNRTLRKAGLVEHVGGGRYRYRLPELVEEAFDPRVETGTLLDTIGAIEGATGLADE
jgi:hypothetical protein